MIRYLPIVMLAFGLVLLSASFAAAAPAPAGVGAMCIDPTAADPFETGQKTSRCWKQLGSGLLVPGGCPVHATLVETEATARPDTGPGWPHLEPFPVGESQPPELDHPPPRA
ncbi:hypothetical protein [Pelagibacterium lacus]|uniref:Secreted protein n=1 Tax=Pelagibacterium lacus TaxID=2282655 RepID=A0A369W2M0_9HYPH|nr:hypothetical protein [Pelagibacterium lacus]RDE08924.1 hypothetical protein DVH29_09240 [Pelagibacterium lacus]